MSEPLIAGEVLARLNSFLPREARWAYFQDGRGPMFIYNTERLHLEDPTSIANGKFESAVAVPIGPGSRSGKATNWEILSESRSLHTLRKDAKARAFSLYQEWVQTGKVEV